MVLVIRTGLFVLVLCLCGFQFGLTQVTYIEATFNDTLCDWETASSNCKLVGADGQANLEEIRLNTSYSPAGYAWIGAFQGYTYWIKMIGCYSVLTTDLDNLIKVERSVNDVATCVEFCSNYSAYALSNSGCHCVSTYPQFISRCNLTVCPGTDHDFCGPSISGNQFTTDLVFYEIKNDITLTQQGLNQCIASVYFTFGTLSYTYSFNELPCSSYVGDYACRTSDNPIRYQLINGILNWTEAAIECSRQGYSVADEYSFNDDITSGRLANGAHFWVGIFRREYMHWSRVLEKSPYITSVCMAAEVGQDGSLRRSLRVCSDTLPYWCAVEAAVTSTSSTAATTDGETTVVQNLNSDNEDPTILIVVVILAVILVIVVIGSIIYCRRAVKRKMLPGNPQVIVTARESRLSASQVILVDDVQIETNEQASPVEEYGTTENERPESNPYHQVEADETKDQSNGVVKDQTENDYNCIEPEYAKPDIMRGKKASVDNVVYDDASNAYSKPHTPKETATGKEQTYAAVTEDVIYDQATATATRGSANIYDHSNAEKTEDESGNTYDRCPVPMDGGDYDHFEHLRKNVPDSDDTYDHIPRTEL